MAVIFKSFLFISFDKIRHGSDTDTSKASGDFLILTRLRRKSGKLTVKNVISNSHLSKKCN